jgi:hypothetical protein
MVEEKVLVDDAGAVESLSLVMRDLPSPSASLCMLPALHRGTTSQSIPGQPPNISSFLLVSIRYSKRIYSMMANFGAGKMTEKLESFLNEKIRTSTDLDSLDALIQSLQDQQELQKQQV